MNLFWSITLLILGVFILYITIKDEKKREKNLTVSYVMHLKGYFGGIGLILIGLIKLLEKL